MTDRALAYPPGEPPRHHSSSSVPTPGILTDAESLCDTWVYDAQRELPALGQMHAVSGRETYIDDAIRNVSEIARRVMQNGESS